MGLPAKKIERRYTYRDLREWPEDERWELIDGVAWNMSAAPSVGHQRLVVELLRDIAAALDNSPCEILIAPLDVLLPASAEQDMAFDQVMSAETEEEREVAYHVYLEKCKKHKDLLGKQ